MLMPTMDMEVMVDMEVMADTVEREKLTPMPTMDMVAVMVDMEDMVDTEAMADTVEREKLKPMPTMDMVVVMVDTVVDMEAMVDTVMAVSLTSSLFITPKSNYTIYFHNTKECIQTAKFSPSFSHASHIYSYAPHHKTSNQC